jgi:hypothetical protein
MELEIYKKREGRCVQFFLFGDVRYVDMWILDSEKGVLLYAPTLQFFNGRSACHTSLKFSEMLHLYYLNIV